MFTKNKNSIHLNGFSRMIKIPKIDVAKTPYVANMRALCKVNPVFAAKLDRIDGKDFIETTPTRNGALTCQLTGASKKSVFIHSRYDPQQEATKWALNVKAQAQAQEDTETGYMPMCFFVNGFGLGYHITALYDNLFGDAFIVVSEPNLKMIRTAFEHFDFSELIENNHLLFVTETNRSEIFKQLQSHSTTMMIGMIFTHALQTIETEFHSKISTYITEYISFVRANLWTLMGCSDQTCKNILHNLPTYVSTPSTDIFKNKFMGKPALCVAAGPSLRKNMALLQKIRKHVIVIAVQTVLKPLLAAGIEPDFVTSLDFSHVCKRFFEDVGKLPNTCLIAEPKAHWDVIDCYRDIGPIAILANDFADNLLDPETPNHDKITAGTTVAHLSYYFAQYIGADPIIFIGQDLGFTDNVYYAPGNVLHDIWAPEMNRFSTIEMKEWERIVRQGKSLRKVTDTRGNPMYTDEEMFTYLQQFERDFAKSKGNKVIDASDGGVCKQYTIPMTLAEAAEKYCQAPLDTTGLDILGDIEWFSESKQSRSLELLKKRVKEAKEFRKICEDTSKLVKNMLTLLDDQPKLEREMQNLDELRTLVKSRVSIYNLITSVGQTGEYIRFRSDRAIQAGNKQGTDRQKMQLMRDIKYMTELMLGSDRFLELLDEGIERFSEEINLQKKLSKISA